MVMGAGNGGFKPKLSSFYHPNKELCALNDYPHFCSSEKPEKLTRSESGCGSPSQ